MRISDYFERMERAVVLSFAKLISDHHLEVRARPEDLSVILQSQLCKLTITLDVNNVFAIIEPGA